jgi:hypothetical protein
MVLILPYTNLTLPLNSADIIPALTARIES